MVNRRRILFLMPQVPYPPEQGTALRNYNLLVQVAQRHDVALLAFAEPGRDDVGPLDEICRPLCRVAPPQRSNGDRLRTLFTSPLPDMAHRLYAPAFEQVLRELVAHEHFDVVQIEGLEMARYELLLRRWSMGQEASQDASNTGAAAPAPRPMLVLDEHNAEYVLQRRSWQTDLALPRRWPAAAYSLIQWLRLQSFERQVCRQADALVACSEADAQALRKLVPESQITVVPNGVDCERYQPGLAQSLPLRHPALVFTGKMDFRPNVDGMLWFYQQVWPRVRPNAPQAHLYIVGKNPSPRLAPLRADPQITLTGYVPDTLPYFAGADVYVVPLRIGGGTRLKVLEAMACGLPIVSTTLGAEGIAVTSEREVLLADAPEAFAQAILDLLSDRQRAQALGLAARIKATQCYDWARLAGQLEQVYAPARGSRN